MTTPEVQALVQQIHWLGHSTFRIGGRDHEGPIIYFDPWRLPDGEPPADMILVSHDHHDHCSPRDIEKIRSGDTIVIANPNAAKVLGAGVTVLRVWQSAPTIGGITLRAVPAYSLDRASHARETGGLGYVLTFPNYTVLYFAGDTDLIPEMERVRCDIALLPVDGIQTMSVDDAARAARLMRAQVAIPMHYGSGLAGTRFDGSRFCDGVKPPVEALLPANEGKDVPTTGPLG